MRILFLGDKRKHRGRGPGYKGDMHITLFKEELARQHDVLFWGWGYYYNWEIMSTKSIYDIFDLYGKPDIILSMCVTDFNRMGLQHIKDIPKAHIVGDYYPSMTSREYKRHNYLYTTLGYNPLIAPNVIIQRMVKKEFPDKLCVLWPWYIDINFYRNYDAERTIDCCFMGGKPGKVYGTGRKEMVSIIKSLPGNNWTSGLYYEAYVDKLNQSKIFVTNNFKLNYWSKKVMEVMSCGCMLLSDHYEDYNFFGFKDREHLVIYKDFDEMRHLIDYYLKHEDEREKIANAGHRYVCDNFNIVKGVEDLMSYLKDFV